MKVQDLFEAREMKPRANGGYGLAAGYDAETKNVLGTVTDWMEKLGVSKADIAEAMKQAMALPSFHSIQEYANTSTATEKKNGTFTFQKPNRDSEYEKYIVYANGQIRSVGRRNMPTRLTAPKPRIVAGSPVKSLVKIYDGAFKELDKKMSKREKAAE